MSSPAPGGAENGKDVEKRRSLGKYVKRMSSVFKRDKPNKTPAATASTSTPTATPASPTIPEASASTSTPAPKPEDKAVASPPEPVDSSTTQQLNRSALQQERARALFAKYGLTLESHEWIASPAQVTDVQRIEKPIRMRVRRECHHCGTTFGADKLCAKCEHKRCKRCPRFPKKKAPADNEKDEDGIEKPKKKKLLTVHSKTTGGELVYRPHTQRVRRRCHKCDTYFVPATATICENCRHIRCTRCPRDPTNTKKYPTGYPGDVDPEEELDFQAELQRLRTWRKPRVRVRWECEECNASFIEGNPACPGCGHQRCEKCARRPLRKSRKEPPLNPDVVRAVEAKLHALAVDSSDPGNSGTEAT